MSYSISRLHSFISLSWIGFRPSVLVGFIVPSVAYTSFFCYGATLGDPLVSFVGFPLAALMFIILLICLLIRFSRWRRSVAEAKCTDAEWDGFVNAALAVRHDRTDAADHGSVLAARLPMLGESSRPAQWLESLAIPFERPVSLTIQSQAHARDFATNFETAALGLIHKQFADSTGSQSPGTITAIGRVMFHGNPHYLVFRQPTQDTMILFFFRIDVQGAVVSILCGGKHFIRRAVATGDIARKKRLSDDEVANIRMATFFRERWLKLCGLSYIPPFGLILLPLGVWFFCIESFDNEPYNWWRHGELACWQTVDQWRASVDWPGLQPDRSAALAELDYMTRIVQHDILREMQAPPHRHASTPAEPRNDNHSPPDDSGGYL